MLVQPQEPSDIGGCGVEPALWQYCVGQGEPLPPGHRTTYYREIDGELRYLAQRQGCMILPGEPLGWTECTGAPEDPEPCRCLCVDDLCPWEQDALTLEVCEQEQPCGEMEQQGVGDPLGPQAQCVLGAMRDRTPGFHELWVEGPWWGDFTRIYSNGDEEVVVLERFESDVCIHPLYGTWGETMRCALPAPEFFEGCLMQPGPLPEECVLTEHWFTGCEPVDAACF